MRKTKIITLVSFLMAIFVAVMFSLTYAGPPVSPPGMRVSPEKLKKRPPLPRRQVDFKLRFIVSAGTCCRCDLKDLDVLFLDGIIVGLTNLSYQHGNTYEGTVEVTYYDILQRRNVTKSATIGLNPDGRGREHVTVVRIPVLAKKSTGITATLKTKGLDIDPNIADNSKTVHECREMLY